MNRSTLKSLAETASEITEALRLHPNHDIQHDYHSVDFAKEYAAGRRGEYNQGGPSAKHEKDSEKFHNTYDSHHEDNGFAGSGTSIYTHRKTGHQYRVHRQANGKGFYGTTHYIQHIGVVKKPTGAVSESTETDPEKLSAHAHAQSAAVKKKGQLASSQDHYAAAMAHKAAAGAHHELKHIQHNRDQWKQHWNHHDYHIAQLTRRY